MTVGSIQFDSTFSAADSLRVADVSGLAPLSFNPPSPESLGRFLSSMSDDKPEVGSIRLALDSIAQNMSSPRDVSQPVAMPASHDSRARIIAEVPVVPVDKAQVVESPAVPVDKPQVVESLGGKAIVVEKPAIEKPVVEAHSAPSTPTAPIAQVVETLVVEQPVVKAPIAPAASSTPTVPVAQGVETLVVEQPVVKAPVAPTTPTAPIAQGVETVVVEKPVIVSDTPVAPAVPATPTVPVAQGVETVVVEKPVIASDTPVAPVVPATPTVPVAQVVETIVVEKPVVEAPTVPAAPSTPSAPAASAAPDSRTETIAEVPVTPATPVATPVVEAPIASAAPVTPVVEAPVAPVTQDSRPATIADAQVVKTPDTQVVDTQVVKTPAAQVAETPVAKSEVASAKAVVSGKRIAAPEEVVVIDLSQESARAATPLREAPFVAAAQQEIAASTASARTEAIVEVVNNVAEAIADQILVTPSLVRGEGQMIVRLKPEVLDGSEIRLSSESGTLAVEIVPSTPNAAKLAMEAMPRLETALAEHVSTFRQVSVSVRKGKGNEVV